MIGGALASVGLGAGCQMTGGPSSSITTSSSGVASGGAGAHQGISGSGNSISESSLDQVAGSCTSSSLSQLDPIAGLINGSKQLLQLSNSVLSKRASGNLNNNDNSLSAATGYVNQLNGCLNANDLQKIIKLSETGDVKSLSFTNNQNGEHDGNDPRNKRVSNFLLVTR